MKGRAIKKLPENYKVIIEKYYNKEITVSEALKELKISRAKFYKVLNEEDKVRKNKVKKLKNDISSPKDIAKELNVCTKTVYNYFINGRLERKNKYLVKCDGEEKEFNTIQEIAVEYKVGKKMIKNHLEGKKTQLNKKGIKVEKQ